MLDKEHLKMEAIQRGVIRHLVVTMLFFFACLLFCSLVVLPVQAAEPGSRNLDSGWQFRAVGNTDRADVKEWHPAQVPGVVQTDLLHDGLIPDPFYQGNAPRLQWIGLADWEYRTTFDADAATMAHEHIDLVFD